MKQDTRKSSVVTDMVRAVISEVIVQEETLEDTASEDTVPVETLEDIALEDIVPEETLEDTVPVEIWEAVTRAALTVTEERSPAMADLRVV